MHTLPHMHEFSFECDKQHTQNLKGLKNSMIEIFVEVNYGSKDVQSLWT